jgi:hypothetical protein
VGQGLGKTKIPGDRRGLGSNDAEREKVPVVSREPWQQASAEEGGLASAGSRENNEKPGCRIVPKAAKGIQTTQDFEIASEEHRRILEIERLQAAEGGAVGFVFWRPREKVRTETCPLQTRFEPGEALGQERNRVISISMAELDDFGGTSPDEAAELRFGSHLGRQLFDRNVFEDDSEDLLVLALGEKEFSDAPRRLRPSRRNDEDDRFAAVGGLGQSFLPTLACDESALGINIEEDVVPAVVGQPFVESDGLAFVDTGMAEEDARYESSFRRVSVGAAPALYVRGESSAGRFNGISGPRGVRVDNGLRLIWHSILGWCSEDTSPANRDAIQFIARPISGPRGTETNRVRREDKTSVPSPSRGSDHPDETEKADSTPPPGLILAAFQESQAFCTEIRLALVRYKFSSRQPKWKAPAGSWFCGIDFNLVRGLAISI